MSTSADCPVLELWLGRWHCRELGNPLMSTSISPHHTEIEYLTDPELIQEEFENTADLFVDGGTGGHIPSTIIDCSGETPKITREGKGELIG